MTRIFIWKSGNPNDREEISFDTYCTRRREGAWEGRFFAKLHEHVCDDTEELILECTEEAYHKNAPAERHERYLNEWEQKRTVLPLIARDLADSVGVHGVLDGDASEVNIEEETEKRFDLELLNREIGDVSLDDIQVALVPVSKKSVSVYKSVVILYKAIFRSAKESRVIDTDPTTYLTAKGGGVPQKDKMALTDEQAMRLLEAIRGLPPHVFVMLGLYAGFLREEILGLKWDSVYLDADAPYLTVRKAWHTENNRPVILDELKTPAAERNIPLPDCLADCLREAKANSTAEYVVANRDGEPLSYTQFKRLWTYIVTRTVKERVYFRYEDGKRVKHTVTPVLGEKAAHNGRVVYSLDFDVTPHQLRHTYITNLIHASVDPKTVQYLAGHESSKITMGIYAKVKYNKPEKLLDVVNKALQQATGN